MQRIRDFLVIVGYTSLLFTLTFTLVTFSSDPSLNKHVASVCSSGFHWLRQLRRVRRSLDMDSTKTLVHAFIASRVDYCNDILARSPRSITDKLQRVMNAAARLVRPRFVTNPARRSVLTLLNVFNTRLESQCTADCCTSVPSLLQARRSGTLYQTVSETRRSAAAASGNYLRRTSSTLLNTLSAVEMLHDSVLYKRTIDIDIDINVMHLCSWPHCNRRTINSFMMMMMMRDVEVVFF